MKKNKRKTSFFLIIMIVASLILPHEKVYGEDINADVLSARSLALYDPQREVFLLKKNENARLGMASTTKIMTALIALESLPCDRLIAADKDSVGIEGSSIYLAEGEILTAEDLIYALMLSSANDAALVLAKEIAGSAEAFSDRMNEYALQLGLSDTHFSNPHGLDSQDHYTSAHDLAIITAKALKNEKFREIVSTKRKTVESSDRTRTLVNHNKLLSSYEGCIGIKTGYTKSTGRSLVSAANRDGYELIAVTIDAPDDWRDHRAMLDFGFSKYEAITLATENEYSYTLPIIGSDKSNIKITNSESALLILEKGSENIKAEVMLDRYLVAPITKGERVGHVIFKNGTNVIYDLPLVATEDARRPRKKWLFGLLG